MRPPSLTGEWVGLSVATNLRSLAGDSYRVSSITTSEEPDRNRFKIYSDSRHRQAVGLVWMWGELGLGAERPAPFGLEILADDACGRPH